MILAGLFLTQQIANYRSITSSPKLQFDKMDWSDAAYITRCTTEEFKNTLQCTKFTVIMQTYDRDEILVQLVNHYAKSALIDRFVIVWNDINRKPDFADDTWQLQPGQELHVFEQEKNSMNNRFNLPQEFVRTDAVIILDDDIHVQIDQLESAFQVWKTNPKKLVSFHKRFISSKPTWPFRCDYLETRKEDEIEYKWFYSYADTCMFPNGTKKSWGYEGAEFRPVLLVGTTFFHRAYIDMYNNHIPKELHTLVDDLMNCDDLVMAMSHAIYTKEEPVHIETKKGYPPLKVIKNQSGHFAGLSSKADVHIKKRSECIRRILQVYGENPLYKNVKSVAVPL
jgi:hypothetical protein